MRELFASSVLVWLLVGCSSTPEEANTSVLSISGEEDPIGAIDYVELSIDNLEFDQHTIFMEPGATVRWTNDDEVAHTITSNDGWFIGDVEPGESFEWQPTQPGTYQYHSEINENIEGVIIVAEMGEEAPDYYSGRPVEQYFADTCGGCHGPAREGGTGPALIPGRLTAKDDFYFTAIKEGRPGTAMPAWTQLGMSDEEVWGLVGFIRSEPEATVVEWTQDQIRDSLAVLTEDDSLPEQPTHTGDLNNLMLITERENRSIAVVDGDTHELLDHIDASYRAHGYVFSPTDPRWAYNMGRDGWVFKIDLYTLDAVRKVRVGHDSRGLAISDDGKYVLAGNYIPNTAVVLDADTLEPLKVITTEGVDPDGEFVKSRVAITSDVAPDLIGPYFVIALKEAGQVWRIDFSQRDFPIAKLDNVGRILHDGFLSPDNQYFYLASQTDNWMSVIDVENWELVSTIPTGDTPHPGSGATWEADGTDYAATVHAGEGKVSIWDLATNEIVGTVPTQGPGLFIRSHDDSPYVWADALFGDPANTTTVFKKEAPFEVVGVIEEGAMTLHPEFTNDGKFVYISDWNGNIVRVYDSETLEKVAEINGVTTPTGIFNTSRRHETLGH